MSAPDPIPAVESAIALTGVPDRFTPTFIATPDVDIATATVLGEHLQNARVFAAASLARNTVRNYNASWGDFTRWCEQRGLSSLPAPPEVVGAYLASLALMLSADGTVVMTPEGDAPARGRLRPQSIGLYLAAINKAHHARGLAKPGDHQHVRAVMAGIRRTFTVRRENAKSALDLPLLERVLDEVRRGSSSATRDRALALLAAQPSAGPGVLARLTWDRVELLRHAVVIHLPSPHRGVAGEVTLTLAATGDPLTCPVRCMNQLGRDLAFSGPVLRRLDHTGRPTSRGLTKQGIAAAERRLARLIDWPHPRLAGAGHEALRDLFLAVESPSPRQVRDEALLCTGWTGALRRSNLSRLNWKDVEIHADGIRVVLSWSKTDQDGADAHEVWLPPAAPEHRFDPYTAFCAWHRLVAKQLAGDPQRAAPDEPVFVPVDRHGRLRRSPTGRLRRLSGEGINEIIKGYAVAAGLDPTRYGAHSLRIGFVTEAFKDATLSVTEVQQVTGHRSVQVLLAYNRAQQNRDSNPAKRLISRRLG